MQNLSIFQLQKWNTPNFGFLQVRELRLLKCQVAQVSDCTNATAPKVLPYKNCSLLLGKKLYSSGPWFERRWKFLLAEKRLSHQIFVRKVCCNYRVEPSPNLIEIISSTNGFIDHFYRRKISWSCFVTLAVVNMAQNKLECLKHWSLMILLHCYLVFVIKVW